ncbi:MAG: hypothetical protein K2M17_03415 [Bacilli bacterium]|nr:hypothetical protein [Bacilli bacterium]
MYNYKTYPDCPLATMLSGMLSAFQRLIIVFTIILGMGSFLFEDQFMLDAFGAAVIFFIVYILIRKYKYKLSDKLATKEYEKNKMK